jgi:Bacterial pre-peptidase C-terminal domain
MTDNSLAKAQSLGILDNNRVTKRDSLSQRDRVDYFKFSLNKSGTANFKLSGLRANANLALLDGTGKVVARSNKGGNKPEKLQRQLAAGNYYLQVKGKGSTGYKLKSSAVVSGGGGGDPIPPGAGSGSATNPIDLGTLNSTPVSRSQDSAGLRDGTKVYYKFQMGQIGEVNFRMSQVTGSGRLSLYYDTNRNGAWDFSDQSLNFGVATGSPSNNTTDTEVLPATGTYFVVGSADNLGSDVRYDMLLTPTLFPGNLPSDPGPEETTAYNLGTLNKGSTIAVKDYVGTVDGKDVYKFDLSSAAKLTYKKLETTANKFSVYSEIFQDTNGNGLKDSADKQIFFSTNTTDLFADVQAGNYFMFVERGDAAYSIDLSAS